MSSDRMNDFEHNCLKNQNSSTKCRKGVGEGTIELFKQSDPSTTATSGTTIHSHHSRKQITKIEISNKPN